MAQYLLKVVTPERTVFEDQASAIYLRGSEGDMGVLARHELLITAVRPCVLRIVLPNQTEKRYAIGGGFLEVGREGTVVLADTAEAPEEIDRRRAEAAYQRAAERLAQGGSDVDTARAKHALARAGARLRATGDDLPSGPTP